MGAPGRTLDGDTVRLWDRLAGAAGVVFVVLLLLGLLTPETPAVDRLSEGVGGRINSDHLGHESSAILTLAAVGFFVIFLAGVWSRLRRSEGGGGMFAGLFVIGGAIFAAIVLVSEGFHLALLKAATVRDSEALPALVRLEEWAGLTAVPAAVAMLLGAAAAIGTSQAFPTWLGLASGGVALVLAFSVVRVFGEAGAGALDSAGIVGFLMINAWVLATSLLLMLRSGDGPNDPA